MGRCLQAKKMCLLILLLALLLIVEFTKLFLNPGSAAAAAPAAGGGINLPAAADLLATIKNVSRNTLDHYHRIPAAGGRR